MDITYFLTERDKTVDKTRVVDDILKRALTTEKSKRFYIPIKNIVLKYYEQLKDLDLTSILQELDDIIDSRLSEAENIKIIESHILKHVVGPVYAVDYDFSEEDPLSTLVQRIDLLSENLSDLKKHIVKLIKERERIMSEIRKLPFRNGYIECKKIKKKNGKVYCYYYLRFYENGKRRSVYLGSKIPEKIKESIENGSKVRELQHRLREIDEKLNRIKRLIERFGNELSELTLSLMIY